MGGARAYAGVAAPPPLSLYLSRITPQFRPTQKDGISSLETQRIASLHFEFKIICTFAN